MSVGEGATICQDISKVPGNLYDKYKPMKPFGSAPFPSDIDHRPRYIAQDDSLPGNTQFTILRANIDGSNHWVNHIKMTTDYNWKGWAILKASYPDSKDKLVVVFPGSAGCVLTPEVKTLDYKIEFSYQIIPPPAKGKRSLTDDHHKKALHSRLHKSRNWAF